MAPYKPIVGENTIYPIPEPTSDSPHEKRIKSIQLQPFFCWAPHVQCTLQWCTSIYIDIYTSTISIIFEIVKNYIYTSTRISAPSAPL